MEVPGPDGHGADAGEMKKLRQLHAAGSRSGRSRRQRI
jgi:hypothetical protein